MSDDLVVVSRALALRDLVIDALALPELHPGEHRLTVVDQGDGLWWWCCDSCGDLIDGAERCPVMEWRAKAIEAVT